MFMSNTIFYHRDKINSDFGRSRLDTTNFNMSKNSKN